MPMSQPITTLLRSDRLNFSHHPQQMPSKQRSLRDASDIFQSMSERSKTTGLPLVMTNIAIDNGPRTSDLFHSFLCVYQRVQDMLPSSIPKPQQTSEATNHVYTKNKSRINIYNQIQNHFHVHICIYIYIHMYIYNYMRISIYMCVHIHTSTISIHTGLKMTLFKVPISFGGKQNHERPHHLSSVQCPLKTKKHHEHLP